MLDSIELLVSQWESDSSLLEANQLSRRMDILDRLDAYIPTIDSRLSRRAEALCIWLEAANSEFFQSIRSEIQQGICPPVFLQELADNGQFPRGNGYDHLDELLSGVLQLDEPDGEPVPTGPENVFYQPTPARHIFALIRAAAISANDVLIDLGSGVGPRPLNSLSLYRRSHHRDRAGAQLYRLRQTMRSKIEPQQCQFSGAGCAQRRFLKRYRVLPIHTLHRLYPENRAELTQKRSCYAPSSNLHLRTMHADHRSGAVAQRIDDP